jgi:hypothetical protein
MEAAKSVLAAMVVVVLVGVAGAGELSVMRLPAPQTEGGKPLMQALRLRATARTFAPEALPAQTLANLDCGPGPSLLTLFVRSKGRRVGVAGGLRALVCLMAGDGLPRC